jgi:hypothetical protein
MLSGLLAQFFILKDDLFAHLSGRGSPLMAWNFLGTAVEGGLRKERPWAMRWR